MFVFLTTLLSTSLWAAERPVINVGSKTFTESYVLAEIISQVIEDADEATVSRKFGLGGTGIVYQALAGGEIDIYPEYTGTISEAILRDPSMTDVGAIRSALGRMNLVVSSPLGFNNTYALAARRDFAKLHGLNRISDLTHIPEIRIGFSHEFMKRPDGYPGLIARYDLKLKNVKPIAHSLAYEALYRDEIDLTDVYSTDAKIEKLGLVVLKDDKTFFPAYFAVLVARKDLAARLPKTWLALRALEGKISEQEMIKLNAMADIDKVSFHDIAANFLRKEKTNGVGGESLKQMLWRLTRQHTYLVVVSLFLSILIGLPLGVLSARYPILGQAILTISGLLQTIPSLALLCFLIPLFGIGTLPALVALFLYGLLPIVTGVHTGLVGLDPRLTESANALGLSSLQRLKLIDLPLASRSIMAGIRTSAIIGIGTATLAALVGAGGYGAPIVTGLALNDMETILTGAVPAAVMALLTHTIFEGINTVLIPKGIR